MEAYSPTGTVTAGALQVEMSFQPSLQIMGVSRKRWLSRKVNQEARGEGRLSQSGEGAQERVQVGQRPEGPLGKGQWFSCLKPGGHSWAQNQD